MREVRQGLHWPGRSPTTTDATIAAVVTVLVQHSVWFWEGQDETFGDRPLSSPIMLVVTASLFWRRRAPLAVATTVALGLLVQTLVSGTFSQTPATSVCIAIALYSLGAYASPGRALVGAALIGAEIQLKGVIATPSELDESPFVALFYWLLILSLVGLGMLVRGRRRTSDLRKRADALEAERATHAQAAVAEERRRIARELHDVVSHNMTATILQAEAAQELLKTQPARADDALRLIQGLSREALGEMRRMLGILRENNGGAPSVPQPRLDNIPALVERTRESGLPVDLAIEGTPCNLAPGIEVSAYRIVQEALTNTRKHAGDTRVRVCIRYGGTRLDVGVTDDGCGAAATDDGTGHGLIGMRERVEFFGGEFTAGPRPGGGFEVHAHLPISPAGR
jgi:signal transduction histidine kinase